MERTADQKVLADLEKLPTLRNERQNRCEQIEVLKAELEILDERIQIAEKTTHAYLGVALSVFDNRVMPVIDEDNPRRALVYENANKKGEWRVRIDDGDRYYGGKVLDSSWESYDEAIMTAFEWVVRARTPKNYNEI